MVLPACSQRSPDSHLASRFVYAWCISSSSFMKANFYMGLGPTCRSRKGMSSNSSTVLSPACDNSGRQATKQKGQYQRSFSEAARALARHFITGNRLPTDCGFCASRCALEVLRLLFGLAIVTPSRSRSRSPQAAAAVRRHTTIPLLRSEHCWFGMVPQLGKTKLFAPAWQKKIRRNCIT